MANKILTTILAGAMALGVAKGVKAESNTYDFWRNLILPSAEVNVEYQNEGNYNDDNTSKKTEGVNIKENVRVKIGKSAEDQFQGFFVKYEGENFSGQGDYNVTESKSRVLAGKEGKIEITPNTGVGPFGIGYGWKQRTESGKMIPPTINYNKEITIEGPVLEAECDLSHIVPGLENVSFRQEFYSGRGNYDLSKGQIHLDNKTMTENENITNFSSKYNVGTLIDKLEEAKAEETGKPKGNLAKYLGIVINNEVEWDNKDEAYVGVDSTNRFNIFGYKIGAQYTYTPIEDVEVNAGVNYKKNYVLNKTGTSTLNSTYEFSAGIGAKIKESALGNLIDYIKTFFKPKGDKK
jgi:hypothetical protein